MNVLITGASKGIGYELVRHFDAAGHHVIAVSRSSEKLDKLRNQCLSDRASSPLQTCVYDLEDLSGMDLELMGFIRQHFDKLDIIINNAGYLVRDAFDTTSEDDIYKCLTVNYVAPARLIALSLPLLKRADRAHVVNIGSMAGFQGSKKFPGLSHYSSAKAALTVLTECLAAEYSDTKIKFNCLALGAVQTEMLAEAFPDFKAPLSAQQMSEYIMDFAIRAYDYFNGKILPVALGNP